MARQKNFILPLTTEIELIAIRGDEVYKKIMTYEEALNLPKRKNWHYIYYEIEFSQFNLNV